MVPGKLNSTLPFVCPNKVLMRIGLYQQDTSKSAFPKCNDSMMRWDALYDSVQSQWSSIIYLFNSSLLTSSAHTSCWVPPLRLPQWPCALLLTYLDQMMKATASWCQPSQPWATECHRTNCPEHTTSANCPGPAILHWILQLSCKIPAHIPNRFPKPEQSKSSL